MWRPLHCASGILVAAVVAVTATSCAETPEERGGSSEPSACSATASRPGFSHYRALKTTLVPGEPRTLRLCQYPTTEGPLEASQLLDHRTPRLVHLLNGLPKAPPGPVPCPANEGVRFVARFGYARDQEAIVSVDTAGCRAVSNGSTARIASRRLTDQLFALMR